MSLQLEQLSKDEARIRHKQELAAQRQERIRNPRALAMGIDTASLGLQVSERRAKEEEARHLARLEKLRIDETCRLLEIAAAEEQALKLKLNEKLKEEWKETALIKKNTVPEPVYDGPPGVGACQSFYGEDNGQKERIRLQKEQMKRWVQEQVAEKAAKTAKEKNDEFEYAAYISAVDEVLENSEENEELKRKENNRRMAQENLRLAEEKRRKEREAKALSEKMNYDEIETVLHSDMMSENVDVALDENGKVKRTDLFRGYTKEQRAQALEENKYLLQQKRQQEEQAKRQAAEEARAEAFATRRLEAAIAREEELKAQQSRERAAKIKEQAFEQSVKRKDEHNARFGSIDDESVFGKFGNTS